MKSIKTLTVLAALMAISFLGASSAMAEKTGLCTADENLCAEGGPVTHVHEATVGGGPATLLNSLGNVTCDVLFLSTSVGTPAAPLIIKGNFTYSNCKRSSESCTVTEKNGPAEIKVLKEGHETAQVTGEGEVNVKCGAFISCTYNGEGLKAIAKGPLLSSESNGEILLNNQVTHKVSGFLCPEKAELDITTTPLSATYLGGTEEKMVCVFVGTNNGFYLGASGTSCTSKDEARIGSYELGIASTDTAKTHVCAFVGASSGFYLRAGNGVACENQDGARLGGYELGITQ